MDNNHNLDMTDNNQYEQQYIFDEDKSDSFELKLTNFSGPLDFLLHLVKENKIEIKDIFVSQVTEQFLQYMTQLSELDVDKAGEYMAAEGKERVVFETKSKGFRNTYHAYFAAKRQALRDFCRKFACRYIPVRTDEGPFYKVLMQR